MGGKSYYCDHCRCYMKNDINVRKTHNAGINHIINKVSHYRSHQSPSILYAEESKKEFCVRYLKGMCKYKLYCQYTHYTEKQLQKLKRIAEGGKERRLANKEDKENIALLLKYANYLPWSVKNYLRRLRTGYMGKLYRENRLPVSLRPMNLRKELAVSAMENYPQWGYQN